MGFFELLEKTSSLKNLYDFIVKLITTEQYRLERQIRKTVRRVYNNYSEILRRDNGEYKSALPSKRDRQLADRVISCMRENRTLTVNDVLPKYNDIPAVIRISLAHKVLQALRSSPEYAVRDYMAWSKQNYAEMDVMLRNLTAEQIRDSAKDNHCPRTSGSRFHYSNEWTKLWGRDKELEQLKEFCLERKSFLWWAITGEGGSGKTRLAYALAKQMERQGWTVCAPASHDKETLYRCSESLPNNTLFLLDYSEYDTAAIGQWMQSLQVIRYRQILIRVLLIQRIGKRVGDIWPDEHVKVEAALKDTVYGNEDFLHLEPLGETDLLRIIKSFAKNRQSITDDEAETINNYLGRVDGHLQRPLFAMILTDAYLDNPYEVRRWDREDILNHIYIKEVEAIQSNIIRHCGRSDDVETLCQIGLVIQMMATMIGGFNVEEDEDLLKLEFIELDSFPRHKQKKFLRTPALFGEDKSAPPYCPSLEPDIIGEYFVLQQWELWGGRKYIEAAWTKPTSMSRFVNRLFQDFPTNAEGWADDLTAIKANACFANNSLTSIHIAEVITSIGDSAFRFCNSLSNITIPDSLTSINNYVFCGCKSLTSIIIPDSVTSIGNGAFSGCMSLTNFTIPDYVCSIGEGAFSFCKMLTSITIPHLVTCIENQAFSHCESLTSISMPDSVISIGDRAFSYCKSLVRINIPDSVTSIGEWAFAECKTLASITIPNSVTTIGDCAFTGCDSLTRVTISNSVTTIRNWTFSYCKSLEFVTIPDSVTSLEEGCFKGCDSITSITIPDSVTAIMRWAFSGCKSLTSVTIPDSVASIETRAFWGCESLQFVSIPDTAVYDLFDFPPNARIEIRKICQTTQVPEDDALK